MSDKTGTSTTTTTPEPTTTSTTTPAPDAADQANAELRAGNVDDELRQAQARVAELEAQLAAGTSPAQDAAPTKSPYGTITADHTGKPISG